jgi:hypothetical protein
LEPKELLVLRAQLELKAQLAHKALKAFWVLKAQLELKAHTEHREQQVKMVRQ